jgi:SNF2 family DNA or RNA helicase
MGLEYMTEIYVDKKSALSFDVTFSKKAIHFSDKDTISLSENFIWDLSEGNLEQIFQKIALFDGTADRKINKNGSFSWSIDLSDYPHITNRFRSLLPQLCMSRKLESILYPFQKEGRDWLENSTTRILADDMGLGKSIQSIAAIEKGVFQKKLNNVLIVCPNTLVSNWEAELKKWCPMLSFFRLSSANIEGKTFIDNKINNHNIIITTYSSLIKLSNILDPKESSFDLIVADEAHKLRNNTSKLNRAFRKIPRGRTWLLTGTPLERDEDDIKNMLACLDPKSASASDQRGDDVIFKSKLLSVSLRRLKKDVLSDLPAVQRVPEILDMGQAQKAHYHSLLKEMQKVPSEERIGFLSKLSFSSIVAADGSSCKFDRAVEICEIAKESSKKVIIFSNFNEALRLLRKRLSQSMISSSLLTGEIEREARERNISRFKTDENISCLLCNSRVGSEGLTLTEASVVIFLNEWWNPSSNRQAEDRVNRIGQVENVLIYILRTKDTIDDNVGTILEGKVDIEKEFLDQLVTDVTS